MKKILFMLLLPISILAQNDFQPIFLNSNAYYKTETAYEIYGYGLDFHFVKNRISETSIGNGYLYYKFESETHTYNYSRLFEPYGACLHEDAYSWLGHGYQKNNDGSCYFFNRNFDTIFIYPMAELGMSWLFYSDDIGNEYNATVTNVSVQEFLGVTDEVKTISITGNGEQYFIELSKNYGFKRVINFRDFPGFGAGTFQVYQYELKGISKFDIGFTGLTSYDIYDYDIGDEIHWSINYGDSYYNFDLYKIRKIIDKETNGNGYTYTIIQDYWGCYPMEDPFYEIDTFTISPGYSSYPIHNPGNLTNLTESNSGRVRLYSKDLNIGVPWENDSCSLGIIYNGDDYYNLKIAGVGIFSGQQYANWDNLLYVKKIDEEWGTPLTPPLGLEDQKNISIIGLYPNPAKDVVNILTAKEIKNIEIKIFNLSGKLLINKLLYSGIKTIDISNLDSGLFFYIIIADKQIQKTGKLMVQKH